MPDDVPVVMDAPPEIERAVLCFRWKGEVIYETEKRKQSSFAAPLGPVSKKSGCSWRFFYRRSAAFALSSLTLGFYRLMDAHIQSYLHTGIGCADRGNDCGAAVTLRFALFGCSGVAAHKGAYGALFKVRCMVAEHMARAPLGALNERRTGDIKTVLNEDIEKLELFLAHNLPDLVCYLVGPVVIFLYLMTVNIPLALISLVPLILAVVVMGMMFRNTDDLMERANRSITTLNSVYD